MTAMKTVLYRMLADLVLMREDHKIETAAKCAPGPDAGSEYQYGQIQGMCNVLRALYPEDSGVRYDKKWAAAFMLAHPYLVGETPLHGWNYQFNPVNLHQHMGVA